MNILGIPSTLSDSELIARYKKTGNQDYLAELFNRYVHLIFGVCLKYLKNEEAAKDGVMTTYEMLIEKLKRHKIDNFGGWIYMVTKNYCLGELRKQATQTAHQKKWEQDVELANEWHLIDNHNLEAQLTVLEKCIETLQDEQQTCVHLFYIKKKSYKEVTNLTGHSLKHVKSYIQNGKRNLKKCIETNLE